MTDRDLKAVKALVDGRALKLRTLHKEMSEYLEMFEGKHWSKRSQVRNLHSRQKDSQVFVNWIFAVIMTNVPLLTDSRPIWHVLSKEQHLQRLADAYTEAGKWLWDSQELDQKVFRVNLDAHIMKMGFWKISFDDEVRIDVPDPRKIIFPAGFEDIRDCPWICYKDELALTEVRRMFPDKRDVILPDSESKNNETIIAQSDWEADDEGHQVTFYEVWFRDNATIKDLRAEERHRHFPDYEADLLAIEEDDELDDDGKSAAREDLEGQMAFPNGRIVSFIAHKNTELRDDASPYEHGECPYIPFYDYVRPHNIVGIAEADQIKTLNWQYNMNLQKLVQNANRYGGVQIVVDSDSEIDAEDLGRKIASGEDHVHVASFANGAPVVQIPIPAVPQSTLQLLNGIPDLIEEVTGVTDISKGVAEKRERQSAMEVQILIESSYTRMRQRVRNLEWSLKRALTLIVSIQQQFYTETRNILTRQGDKVQTIPLSNQPQQIGQDIIRDKTLPESPNALQRLGIGKVNHDKDYEKFLQGLGADRGAWPGRFYMDFEISLETNSSLPQDRQTLANLALRLFQMEGIDRQALLETLQFPNAEDILQRMLEKEQAELQAKAGPPPQEGGTPGSPLTASDPADIADNIRRSMAARGGNNAA